MQDVKFESEAPFVHRYPNTDIISESYSKTKMIINLEAIY